MNADEELGRWLRDIMLTPDVGAQEDWTASHESVHLFTLPDGGQVKATRFDPLHYRDGIEMPTSINLVWSKPATLNRVPPPAPLKLPTKIPLYPPNEHNDQGAGTEKEVCLMVRMPGATSFTYLVRGSASDALRYAFNRLADYPVGTTIQCWLDGDTKWYTFSGGVWFEIQSEQKEGECPRQFVTVCNEVE